MLSFISQVIDRFGGRPAGTEAEHGAQQFTRDTLAECCDEARLEPFEAHLTSHFGILKPLSLIYVGIVALFPFAPRAAIALAVLNALAFLSQFVTGRHRLDFLYPTATSWNVEGVLEPTGEVRSTLIVAGHIDSVYEFKWWYRLGSLGGVLTVVAGFVLSLQGVGLVVAHLAGAGLLADVAWWLQIALAPVLIVLYDMHDKSVRVEGAVDNLTGVAMAVEMARTFSKERLRHTRLRLVSFGAEEPFLRGSESYARQRLAQLRAENALLINIDTIKEKRHLSIVRREINTLASYPRELRRGLRESFAACGVPVKEIDLGVGGTDGAAFRRLGLPAVSIIGMDAKKFDPAYHTRLDTLDVLNPDGITALREVLVHFIGTWDAGKASTEGVQPAPTAVRDVSSSGRPTT